MSFTYNPLNEFLGKNGMSINFLYSKKVITDNSAQNIRKGKSISLDQINSICQYLDLPIEQVVRITKD